MREITFNEIEQIWANNDAPLGLYIHSPFCKSICKYCVYRGCIKDKNFDKYFNDYLPGQIEKYLPIINNQDVKEIYFGGGTPNIVPDLSNLEPAFKKIKHIKPREKTIELHFNIPITDQTIAKVIKEGFTTVLLCIQTFNERLLARQNRVNEKCNDLEKIIGKFHEAGVRVAADFIYFPDDEEGFTSLLRDMCTVARLNNLFDEITISACYQDKEGKEEIIAEQFETVLNRAGFEFSDYAFNMNDSPATLAQKGITSRTYVKEWLSFFNTPHENLSEYIKLYNGIRIFRAEAVLDGNFYKFCPYLGEVSHGVQFELDSNYYDKETAAIGIGSYHNPDKYTWSRCGAHGYHEIWDGQQVRYFLTFERTFYQKARDFLDWMEKVSDGKEPDLGTELTFKNFSHIHIRTENVCDAILDYELSSPYKSSYIENICKHEHELEGFYN